VEFKFKAAMQGATPRNTSHLIKAAV